jgi:hypothetical protein
MFTIQPGFGVRQANSRLPKLLRIHPDIVEAHFRVAGLACRQEGSYPAAR